MKSFHFFYLSHNHGLLYDYFDTDYQEALIQPTNRYLNQHHVSIKLNRSVEETGRDNDRFIVESEPFDYLILATDVLGTKTICANSPWIRTSSDKTYSELMSLKASGGYAVYRIWLAKEPATSCRYSSLPKNTRFSTRLLSTINSTGARLSGRRVLAAAFTSCTAMRCREPNSRRER